MSLLFLLVAWISLDDIVWYREYLKFAMILLGNAPMDSSLSTLSFQSATNGNNLKQLEDVRCVNGYYYCNYKYICEEIEFQNNSLIISAFELPVPV